MPSGMKSETRAWHLVRFGIVKTLQLAAKKNSITRTATYIQAAKEAERGIGNLKVGDVATASLFGLWALEFGTSCCVSTTAWHGDSPTTSWPETDSVSVFTSKEEQV